MPKHVVKESVLYIYIYIFTCMRKSLVLQQEAYIARS